MSAFSGMMSALPPKADIDRRWLGVRFVPIADTEFANLQGLS